MAEYLSSGSLRHPLSHLHSLGLGQVPQSCSHGTPEGNGGQGGERQDRLLLKTLLFKLIYEPVDELLPVADLRQLVFKRRQEGIAQLLLFPSSGQSRVHLLGTGKEATPRT